MECMSRCTVPGSVLDERILVEYIDMYVCFQILFRKTNKVLFVLLLGSQKQVLCAVNKEGMEAFEVNLLLLCLFFSILHRTEIFILSDKYCLRFMPVHKTSAIITKGNCALGQELLSSSFERYRTEN